jgi:hypothetical protein
MGECNMRGSSRCNWSTFKDRLGNEIAIAVAFGANE